MIPQILFAFGFVPFVALQGMSIALSGRTGGTLRKISYLFALIAVTSYGMFLKELL